METLEKSNTVSTIRFYEERYQAFFIKVVRFVAKRGGTLTYAEDLYHDALIVFYEKTMQHDFVLLTSEEAYIMGIVKNLWSQKIKRELKTEMLPEFSGTVDAGPDSVDHSRLYSVVLSAGKKCLDLLSMFYHRPSTLGDIAAKLGFRSKHSVAVQKYKCLEKIREIVKQKSLYHEDFLE